MRVTRIQHPVGQGSFHSGCLEWDGGDGKTRTLSYIYDCGSTARTDALRSAIASFAPQHRHIDALIVPHLHRDRVNGIDGLLAQGGIRVGTVFIPHAGIGATIADLLAARLEGTLSGAQAEASLRPGPWFGRRGVGQVVRVLAAQGDEPRGAGPDDAPPGGRRPDEPGFPLDAGSGPDGPVGARAGIATINSGTIISPAGTGPDFGWVLVPHVDPPPPDAQFDEFELCVRSVLQLRNRQRITPQRLLEALRCPSKLADMKRCHEFLCPWGGARGHSRTSMSLYSGPPADAKLHGWNHEETNGRTRKARRVPVLKHGRAPVGWLGTGDSELGDARIRWEWETTYRPYRNRIFTVLLPHHGSDRNFDPGLLEFTDAPVFVSSAKDRSEVHPGPKVDRTLRQDGRILHRVTENPQSTFREEISPVHR